MNASVLKKMSFYAQITARYGVCSALVGFTVTLLGCVSSPGHHDADDVTSFETNDGRYVVYYKSTGEASGENVSFQPDRGPASMVSNAEKATSSDGSSGNTPDKNSSALDDSESGSTPGFDDFQDSYDTSDSETDNEVYDPLEGYNRFMFQVNDDAYTYVLKPTATGWQEISPKPARQALDRGFDNLFFPIRFVNSLLQAEVEGAGRELGRFTINTTVGVAGLFDPARHWFGWKANEEDFGLTLGTWGVGPGFPLVLPLAGPSNLRDAGGRFVDGYLNPVNYIDPFGLQLGVRGFYLVNFASVTLIGVYDRQKKEALDPYTFFRNIYRQHRRSAIKK
jgi:phospholipid-binding lipoprotein MlaA